MVPGQEREKKMNKNSPKKTTKGEIGCAVIILLTGIFLIAILTNKDNTEHKNDGDWDIVSTSDYIRDGQKCIGYRIYITSSYATNESMKDIFTYLTKQDNYYLHTVWFYHTRSNANGTNSADSIMEETSPGKIPEIKNY